MRSVAKQLILNVAAGKTFYTGADGKKRPDGIASNFMGQAGRRSTRPFLLPKGAYNHAQGKPFEQKEGRKSS